MITINRINVKSFFLSHSATFCCTLCTELHYTSSFYPWYLYLMVSQTMLRTHEGKKVFFEKKMNLICDISRSNQMPLTKKNNRDCSLRAHLFMSYHII